MLLEGHATLFAIFDFREEKKKPFKSPLLKCIDHYLV